MERLNEMEETGVLDSREAHDDNVAIGHKVSPFVVAVVLLRSACRLCSVCAGGACKPEHL